jgi:hypothetical protein
MLPTGLVTHADMPINEILQVFRHTAQQQIATPS